MFGQESCLTSAQTDYPMKILKDVTISKMVNLHADCLLHNYLN